MVFKNKSWLIHEMMPKGRTKSGRLKLTWTKGIGQLMREVMTRSWDLGRQRFLKWVQEDIQDTVIRIN